MIIYEYENTFFGLLSALYTYYTSKDVIILNCDAVPGLLNTIKLGTNNYNAEKFIRKIIYKFGYEAYENIYFAYLYGEIDIESSIIQYINYLSGKYALQNDTYFRIKKYRKAICNSINRYQGFLRFSDIGGILYAKYDPEYDITAMLGDYFAKRLYENDFIIHDLKRNILLFYKNNESALFRPDNIFLLDDTDNYEKHIQNMFKTYFNSVSIKERKNYKLQRNMFPLKFREYATEFDEG